MMLVNHQNIVKLFSTQLSLSEAESHALIRNWTKEKTLSRNEYLISRDEVETNLYYVAEGAMRIYFPHDDEEVCVGFAYTNSLICSYPSFIQNKPSDYYIQALTGTQLLSISRDAFYALFDTHPRIERCWRMIEEQALLGKIEREVEMLTYSPDERAQRLMLRSPQLFQIVPKKYIASYLRMKPETLSRVVFK
jgi:CRP-like cAMP-binding protein